MKQTKRYHVWPRNASLAQPISALKQFAEERGRTLNLRQCHFWLLDGNASEFAEVEKLEQFVQNELSPSIWILMAGFPRIGERDSNNCPSVFIDVAPWDLLVTFGADDPDLLRSLIECVERAFQFQQLPEPSTDIVTVRPLPHATALIGCHFDSAGKAAAARLSRFLTLLRFARVEVADEFRSDSVPEKIKRALERNDFYFGIVTGEREHDWIVSETSYALGRDKSIVLIVQREVKNFNPAIAGRDRERLVFTHSIDETFVGILEEIRRLGVVGL